MNPYSSATVSGNSTDTINTRAFLQQAVDHYPRLAAFYFTLALPYREIMADHRSLILRFHTEVWQRIGEYSWQRQQERRSSPPTLLRWVWESSSAPLCKMVLLLNFDTLGAGRHTGLDESTQQTISKILSEAWLKVTGAAHNGVTNITPIILNRAGRDAFTVPFNQLTSQVNAMITPVTTARTSVTR
ncbi:MULTISPECIES: YagK/YfjJ domain-containing protein [Serratia]|uniref:Inovirus Gp2 family protein n=2 Tax=Serratia TaxID=613 RepID=A0A9X8VDD7_SERMA|nr:MULTISPECIES: inovirus-type Gp2 protein [Serratia]MBS3894989.1 inovirus-type Gp2 protein [Serratia marcescens]TXE26716.1 inovirus Gp2 family protein [Serratia ureilytica]HBC7421404.1 inovirus-type Gp2 protein [Serratia marcescens]